MPRLIRIAKRDKLFCACDAEDATGVLDVRAEHDNFQVERPLPETLEIPWTIRGIELKG